MEDGSIYLHAISESGRLLPSSSRWSTIELEFGSLVAAPSLPPEGCSPSGYSKSYKFDLAVADKPRFKRFVSVLLALALVASAAAASAALLRSKVDRRGPPADLPLALGLTLSFFDAQKSGVLPKNSSIKFRGDSGLNDVDTARDGHSLVGGFYDSGNNVKFSLPAAYTVTLLSWSAIEYRNKYSELGQLDNIIDIIKWGCEYLLKLYVPSDTASSKPALLYSQVGSTKKSGNSENDVSCWQRPEDMNYTRPVSACRTSAADIAGEIVAALAAASLLLGPDRAYSSRLARAAESLLESARSHPSRGTYTSDEGCGGEARGFYDSTSHLDELAWGGTWLFLATGKFSHLEYATRTFELALSKEPRLSRRVFDWNNKLAANAVLLSRLRYLNDPGYPYETTLKRCTDMASTIMCSYVSPPRWSGLVPSVSPGGLIFPAIVSKAPLQFAATAAFLSKLYADYLDLIHAPGGTCGSRPISSEVLQRFAKSQVDYILGDNPMKMSYLVGFGDRYPKQVHHRGASIPWNGRRYSCTEGKRWKESKDPNPNVLLGAMVAGPGQDDKFFDVRDQAKYTEATIAGNAGLVAALVALLDGANIDVNGGIDRDGIFAKIT